MQITPAGENSLIVYLQEGNLADNNRLISQLSRQLLGLNVPWLVDLIPSYESLLVIFDLLQTDQFQVQQTLRTISLESTHPADRSDAAIELPVLYAAPFDNDLDRISQHTGLSHQQIITLHSSQVYRVYAVGFSPGFGFLGQVPAELATPRLATPRLNVPKGAVAIADRQTAVYPNESPGGWNVIGLCPVRLFCAADQSMVLSVGDRVRFVSVDEQEYSRLGGCL